MHGRQVLIPAAAVIVLTLVTWAAPSPGRAATTACELLPPLDEVVATGPIVFIGTVASLTPGMGEVGPTVVFRVDEIWRGANIPPVVTVLTGFGNVPTTYRVGATYLVVPRSQGSDLADNCTATRELLAEHLELRPPDARLPDGTPVGASSGDAAGPALPMLLGVTLAGVGLLGLLVLIGATWVARRAVPLAAWLAAGALAITGAAVITWAGGLRGSEAAVTSPTPSGSAVPTVSATPQTMPPGAVLAQVTLVLDTGPAQNQRVVLMEDGLVVENREGAFLQRRLGAEAMAALRDALYESGVFDKDANLFPQTLPGVEEPGHGGSGYDIVVHHPDRTTRVFATTYFLPVEAYEVNPSLDQALAIGTSLHTDMPPLGVDDWTDAEALPYLASAYRLQAGATAFAGDSPVADLRLVDWPLERPIDDIGPPVELTLFQGALPCAEINADQAVAMLETVQIQGVALGASASTRADMQIQDPTVPALYAVTITPLLPGESACEPDPVFEGPGPPAEPSLELGATAEIRVDNLRLRSEPSTGGEVVGRSVGGDRVEVVAGPSEDDGFVWYQVRLGDVSGWVATGPAADPWLVASRGEPELVVLRLDTCSLVCEEILWYPGSDPSKAHLLRRVVDVGPAAEIEEGLILDGADELLADLLGSGLLEESALYEPKLLPGAEPPDFGDAVGRKFALRRGSAVVAVSWVIPPDPERYEDQPEADELTLLADRLASQIGPR